MSKTFAERELEDRRLVILRLLAERPGYSSSVSLLQAALEDFTHHVSRDRVASDLAWLVEQNLITTAIVAEKVLTGTITARGIDVVAGKATVPGVKRPGPGS